MSKRKDQLKRQRAIKKAFKSTFEDGLELENELNFYDILRDCENADKLFKYEDAFLGFCLTEIDNKSVVRMIIAMKEEKRKVKNVQNMCDLIYDLEWALTYVDNIYVRRANGLICLDAYKII